MTASDSIPEVKECEACHGEGGGYVRTGANEWEAEECPACHGTGQQRPTTESVPEVKFRDVEEARLSLRLAWTFAYGDNADPTLADEEAFPRAIEAAIRADERARILYESRAAQPPKAES